MRFLKIVSILLLAFFVLLPVGVKYGMVYFLEENGVDARIDDVDINLFAGNIGLEGVHIYGEANNELHLGNFQVDVRMLDLFSKRFLIESINIANFKITVTQKENDWIIGGLLIPSAQETTPEGTPEPEVENELLDWTYGLKEISINGIHVGLDSSFLKSSFSLNHLALNDIYSWLPEEDGKFDLNLAINNTPIKLSGQAQLFSEIRKIHATLKIDPLQVQPFVVSLQDMPFESLQMAVYSDMQLALQLGADANIIDANGIFGVSDIETNTKSQTLTLANLEWSGKQNIQLHANEEKNVSLAGSLVLDQLNVQDQEQDVQLTEEKITWNGDVDLQINKDAALDKLKSLSTLDFGKLRVLSPGKNISIAGFESWKLENIELDGIESVKLKSTSIENIVLLKDLKKEKIPAVLDMQTAAIENIAYTPEKLEINSVELKKFKSSVILNDQAKLDTVEALTASQEDKAVTPTEETQTKAESPDQQENQTEEDESKESSKLKLLVRNILIDSGSELHFTDNSVTPVFETHLHEINLSADSVNQLDPEVFSNVVFKVNVDDYGKIDVKGKLQPFKEKMNAQLSADLKSIELVPFSSYAGKFAGLHIKRGMLDANADVKVKDNLLEVKNDFYFNQLNIESDESETSKDFLSGMPMPLDLTLDVLRDKNNVIHLQIPVKGSVDSPDFSLKDVYNKAMAKALKFAATHYLTQAVQPLGLILTAGKLVGKAMAPSFEPLIYAPGSVDISSENKKHLKSIAKLLQDRDKIRLTLCGMAAESDWQVLLSKDKENKILSMRPDALKSHKSKTLLKLANERTKTVKNYFVMEYKINSARLFACNGKIHKDEQGLPQLDITL